MTIEEKIENLETGLIRVKRLNRLLLAVMISASVSAAIIMTLGAADSKKIIEADQFNLLDADGKTVACFDTLDNLPRLRMYDKSGKSRAGLTVLKDGPGLLLFDENGKMRAGLTVTKDGPKLNFFDENEKNRAILAALKDGPGLSLCDVNEKSITSLVLTKDGPMLGLSDESGRPRAFLKVVKEGPALGLFDNQRCRVNLGVGRITTPDGKTVEYPESSLLLFNPDGKVRWQAP